MTNNVTAISPIAINTKADADIAIMIVIDPSLLPVFCITLSDDDNENEVDLELIAMEFIGVVVKTEDILLVRILILLVLLTILVAVGVADDFEKEEELVGDVEIMEVD